MMSDFKLCVAVLEWGDEDIKIHEVQSDQHGKRLWNSRTPRLYPQSFQSLFGSLLGVLQNAKMVKIWKSDLMKCEEWVFCPWNVSSSAFLRCLGDTTFGRLRYSCSCQASTELSLRWVGKEKITFQIIQSYLWFSKPLRWNSSKSTPLSSGRLNLIVSERNTLIVFLVRSFSSRFVSDDSPIFVYSIIFSHLRKAWQKQDGGREFF